MIIKNKMWSIQEALSTPLTDTDRICKALESWICVFSFTFLQNPKGSTSLIFRNEETETETN